MGEEEADRAVEKEDMKAGGVNEIVNQTHKKRIRESKHVSGPFLERIVP
jgi:hypothetical protein